jgi:hypothetical protein
MWRLVEVLLDQAGLDIWKCLLAPHHTCHKYVYRYAPPLTIYMYRFA